MKAVCTALVVVIFSILTGCATRRISVESRIGDISSRDGVVSVSVSAEKNRAYQLQSATNLSNPEWISLGSVVTAMSGTVIFTDTNLTSRQRFYRVVSPSQ